MAVETIPLPSEKVSNGDDFEVTVADLTAWPDQKLRFQFNYNPHMERWLWECQHVGEGRAIRPSVATLERQYGHWPYILFEFIVPSGDASRVRAIDTDTLDTDVKLACFPGPLGGQFLQDSGFTAEEERELLSWGTEAL